MQPNAPVPPPTTCVKTDSLLDGAPVSNATGAFSLGLPHGPFLLGFEDGAVGVARLHRYCTCYFVKQKDSRAR